MCVSLCPVLDLQPVQGFLCLIFTYCPPGMSSSLQLTQRSIKLVKKMDGCLTWAHPAPTKVQTALLMMGKKKQHVSIIISAWLSAFKEYFCMKRYSSLNLPVTTDWLVSKSGSLHKRINTCKKKKKQWEELVLAGWKSLQTVIFPQLSYNFYFPSIDCKQHRWCASWCHLRFLDMKLSYLNT